MSMRKMAITGLLALCALGLASGPAVAETGHKFVTQITEVPLESGVVGGPFYRLQGLTLDSGTLYAFDGEGHGVVDEFSTVGGFVKQIPGVFGEGVAVSHATGDVYVVNQHPSVVVESPTGATLAELSGKTTPSGGFGNSNVYLALDNSTNPLTAGDIYVSDPGDKVVDVLRAEPGEKYVTQLKFSGGPRAVAVDATTGDLLVCTGAVEVFKPKAAGEYELLFQVTGPPGEELMASAVATDGAGDIYVSGSIQINENTREEGVYQFTPAGGYLGKVTETPGEAIEGPSSAGLAVGPAGEVFVSVGGQGRAVDVFGPSVTVPDVSGGAASGVHGRGATLNGAVNPEGLEVATCEFEYGTTSSLGSTAPCSPAPGSGSSPMAVAASLTELAPGATYHYRLAVTDAEGVTVRTLREEFTMPVPQLVVAPASNVRQTSATLNGTVENPHEVPVTGCQFEFGATPALGSTAACSPAPGSGPGAVAVAASVTGLVFDTLGYYRLAVTVAGGPTLYSSVEALYTSPIVTGTVLASGITSFAATLTGVVEAGEITASYRFVYGLSGAYGSSVPQPDSVAGAAGLHTVSQTLTGLEPGTTYHVALVATNAGGGETVGPDETFTTRPLVPPAVSTAGAEAIGQTSATVTGFVDAEGLPTTYRFEYGPTGAYGSSWPLVQVFAGSGSASQAVAVGVPNLAPGTTYHYRLVASNEDGTSYGADRVFTTPDYPVSIVRETPISAIAAVGFVTPEAKRSTSKPTKGKGRRRSRRGTKKGRRRGGRKR